MKVKWLRRCLSKVRLSTQSTREIQKAISSRAKEQTFV